MELNKVVTYHELCSAQNLQTLLINQRYNRNTNTPMSLIKYDINLQAICYAR